MMTTNCERGESLVRTTLVYQAEVLVNVRDGIATFQSGTASPSDDMVERICDKTNLSIICLDQTESFDGTMLQD